MSRNINSATLAQLPNTVVPVAVMVEIGLSAGNPTVHVWSGYGPLVYNGNTYLGVGNLGSVSVVQETNSVYASGASISLSGVDPNDLTEALSEIGIGQPATLYMAFMGPSGIIGAPVVLFSGLTDQVSIAESVETCSIQIDIESKLSQLQRNREYRYTDQMQRYLHPNDTSFIYVNTLQNFQGTWGFRGNGI